MDDLMAVALVAAVSAFTVGAIKLLFRPGVHRWLRVGGPLLLVLIVGAIARAMWLLAETPGIVTWALVFLFLPLAALLVLAAWSDPPGRHGAASADGDADASLVAGPDRALGGPSPEDELFAARTWAPRGDARVASPSPSTERE